MSDSGPLITVPRRPAWFVLVAVIVAAIAWLGIALAQPQPGAADSHCDAVVPGSFDTIQTTVDAADPGDTICVEAGTHTESVTVDVEGLTIEGAQAGVDGRDRDPDDPSGESEIDGSFNLEADGVTIDGFYITGDEGEVIGGINTSPGASGYQLLNNVITENDTGIRLWSDGTTQTVVRHNWLDNNYSGADAPDARGIFLGPAPLYESSPAASNMLIQANRFTNHTGGDDPASIHLGQGVTQDSITIASNEFTDDGSITLIQATNIIVANNAFSGGASGTTRVFLGGGTNSVSIVGNSFVDAPAWAIQLMNIVAGGNVEVEVHYNAFAGSGSGALNAPQSDGNGRAVHAGPLPATHNWWGTENGPSGDGPGDGDAVAGGLPVFDPWISSIELEPSSATVTAGETVNINATLLDSDGAAVPDLDANFTRTGANPGEEDTSFDASGVASHSFEALAGTTDVTVQPRFAGVLSGPVASGTYIVQQPDITISKEAEPSEVAENDDITFTITVSNGGTAETNEAPQGSVGVADTLPDVLEDIEVDEEGAGIYSCDVTGQDVTCANSAGDHMPGEEHVITVTATVAPDAALGGYANSAAVELDGDVVSEDSASFTVGETPPRTITIEKLVEGDDPPQLDVVAGTISPYEPGAWAIASPPGTTVLQDVAPESQTIRESDPGDDWDVAYAVLPGDASCDEADEWTTFAAVVSATGDARVCVRNTYDPAPPPEPDPEDPETHTHELTHRWSLVGWMGGTMDVEEALRGEGANDQGDDIFEQVTVVWSWNGDSQAWEAYFPGDDDAANDLDTFEPGAGYWIAIEGPGDITWEVALD